MQSILFVVGLLLALSSPCNAEIYKYRDADGNWQFTDREPLNKQKVEIVDSKKAKSSKSGSLLNPVEDGKNPIQTAAHAVVSIETPVGSGSGFFINAEGYLLTNRHVVRGNETDGWKEQEKALEQTEKALDTRRRAIDRESRKLAKFHEKLRDFKKTVDNMSNQSIRAEEQEKYLKRKAYLDKRQREHNKIANLYKKDKKNYSDRRSNVGFNAALSATASSFDVTLKDGEKRRARLISLSKKFDLALLKIDGVRTTFIPTGNASTAQQGQKVYAIGSPLGINDIVTSGVLSRVEEDLLITDSQILPGNSGGPLINTAGQVLGINTAKAAGDVYGDGLGLAIPIDVAMQEFARKLR